MADFKVKYEALQQGADQANEISARISKVEQEMYGILNRLSIHSKAAQGIRKSLRAQIQNVETEAEKLQRMSGALREIERIYRNTENAIANNQERKGIRATISDLQQKIRSMLPILGVEEAGCYSGDPVNLCNGNYIFEKECMRIGGSIPLVLRIFYNSQASFESRLGKGWMHNYEVFLEDKEDHLCIYKEDGASVSFLKEEGGVFSPIGNAAGRLKKTDDGYEYTNAEETVYCFSEIGRLTALRRKRLINISLLYGEAGLLQRTQTETGDGFSFYYNENDQLERVEDHMGRVVSFMYTEHRMTTFIDAAGNETGFAYDENGLLCTMVAPNGTIALENMYDSHARVLKQIFPDGGEITYEYQDDAGQVILTEQNGNRVVCEHDYLFRNTKTEYADGIEYFTYNEQNQKTSFTDKRGNQSVFSYDENGYLQRVVNAEQVSVEMAYTKDGKLQRTGIGGRWMYKLGYDAHGNQTTMENALGEKAFFEYDEKHRLTGLVMEDGSRMEFCYEENGLISEIVYPIGGKQAYEYDSLHRVSATIDGCGNRTTYQYNEKDELICVTNAQGKSSYYEYDACGNMVHVIDFDGSETHIRYNEVQKAECITDKNGNNCYFTYDKMWNPVSFTDAEGNTTVFGYDALHRGNCVIAPDGGKTTLAYDACGNITARTDANGNTFEMRYDKANRLVEVKAPDGSIQHACYNKYGGLQSVSYPDGSEEFYEYDCMNRQTAKIERNGRRLCVRYTTLGNVEEIYDDQGVLASYEYYPGGLLKKESFADGSANSYHYDENRRISAVENQDGFCWRFGYDALERIVKIENSDGVFETYSYDAVGNMTARTTADGQTTSYVYTASGELCEVRNALGGRMLYQYDKNSMLSDVYRETAQRNQAQERSLIRHYERDAAGNVVKVSDAAGNAVQYSYDLCGNLIRSVDEEGNETKLQYGFDGRPESVLYGDGRQVLMRYNALRQLTEMEDWLGVTRIVPDCEDRPLQVTYPTGETISYEWNQRGQCSAQCYPDGSRMEYIYDDASRLIQCRQGEDSVFYQYDQGGRLSKKIFPTYSSSYQYNAAGQLSALRHTADGSLLAEIRCTYDRAGRKSSVVRKGSFFGKQAGEYRYGYTPLGFLESVAKDGREMERYTYDDFGNRTEAEINGEKSDYHYNVLNQLVRYTRGGKVYSCTYDRRGSLISEYCGGELSRQLTFDARNRLAGIDTPEGSSTFVYNGFGDCVSEQLQWKQAGKRNRTRHFVNDPARSSHQLLSMREGKDCENYYRDNGLLARRAKDGMQYCFDDERQLPLGVFGGVRCGGYADAFGDRADASCISPFAFAGYLECAADGLLYANLRTYMPSAGRFLSRDPYDGDLYDPLTYNPYAYCKSDPLNNEDPTGEVVLAVWLAAGIVGAVAGAGGVLINDAVKYVQTGTWTWSSWSTYVGAGAGGFAGGALGTVIGPAAAGAIGGAVEGVVSNGLDMADKLIHGESVTSDDWIDMGTDTVVNGLIGGVAGKAADWIGGKLSGITNKLDDRIKSLLRIPGINKGKGSMGAVWKQLMTKAQNNQIHNMSLKSMGKGLVYKLTEKLTGKLLPGQYIKKCIKGKIEDLGTNVLGGLVNGLHIQGSNGSGLLDTILRIIGRKPIAAHACTAGAG